MTLFLWTAAFFCCGYYFSEFFFWLPWVGFAVLCYLYQTRRHAHLWKGFLLPCWGVFLAIYAVCFGWIQLHDDGVYVMAVLIASLIFPLLFLLHHLISAKVRSGLFNVALAFVLFFSFEGCLSRIPIFNPVALDIFFRSPVAMLGVLKYIHFTGWSAWVFAACFAAACCWCEKKIRSFVLLAVLVGGMGGLVVFAHIQNASNGKAGGVTGRIALVQHNLPYPDDWRIAHWPEIKEKYRQMALRASQGNPDLIIFPLYSIPGDVYRKPAFLEELARLAKCPILFASHIPIKAGDDAFDHGFMNLSFLYDAEGSVKDIYKSVEALPFLDQTVETAEKYRVIQGPFGKIGVLLCFEETIPRLSQEAVRQGARILVAQSNPGAFQETMKPRDLLFQDQVRAAETGLPLLRVSSNGYSALIDRTGRVVARTELGVEDILQVELSCVASAGTGVAHSMNPALKVSSDSLKQSK